MPNATQDVVLKIGSITSTSIEDIDGDSATPRMRPGTLSLVVDAFGYKVLRYVRVEQSGGVALGELLSRPANVAVDNITSGTTTSLVTTGLTADVHEGKLLYVLDNDDSAGAAPEGEVSIVASNTATAVTVERDRTFSVALAANDDLILIANWQAEDSADGDLTSYVHGIVVGRDGITDRQHGWVQMEGFCQAETDAATQTANEPLVADAAQLGDDTSDGIELWCAIALAAASSDNAAALCPVDLKLFSGAVGNGTP